MKTASEIKEKKKRNDDGRRNAEGGLIGTLV